jgi:hypothetical protein
MSVSNERTSDSKRAWQGNAGPLRQLILVCSRSLVFGLLESTLEVAERVLA